MAETAPAFEIDSINLIDNTMMLVIDQTLTIHPEDLVKLIALIHQDTTVQDLRTQASQMFNSPDDIVLDVIVKICLQWRALYEVSHTLDVKFLSMIMDKCEINSTDVDRLLTLADQIGFRRRLGGTLSSRRGHRQRPHPSMARASILASVKHGWP